MRYLVECLLSFMLSLIFCVFFFIPPQHINAGEDKVVPLASPATIDPVNLPEDLVKALTDLQNAKNDWGIKKETADTNKARQAKLDAAVEQANVTYKSAQKTYNELHAKYFVPMPEPVPSVDPPLPVSVFLPKYTVTLITTTGNWCGGCNVVKAKTVPYMGNLDNKKKLNCDLQVLYLETDKTQADTLFPERSEFIPRFVLSENTYDASGKITGSKVLGKKIATLMPQDIDQWLSNPK